MYGKLRSIHGDQAVEVVDALNNVARFAAREGARDVAVREGRAAFAAYRRTLGESHPKTLIAQENLAFYLLAVGEETEADGLITQALGEWRTHHGLEHPKALSARRTAVRIAMARHEGGDFVDEALGVLEASRAALGDSHPNTLRSELVVIDAMLHVERRDAAREAAAGALLAVEGSSPEAEALRRRSEDLAR